MQTDTNPGYKASRGRNAEMNGKAQDGDALVGAAKPSDFVRS